MEEFISNGYYRVQQSLTNSQQQIDELLKPLLGDDTKSEFGSKPKENIDNVSK